MPGDGFGTKPTHAARHTVKKMQSPSVTYCPSPPLFLRAYHNWMSHVTTVHTHRFTEIIQPLHKLLQDR